MREIQQQKRGDVLPRIKERQKNEVSEKEGDRLPRYRKATEERMHEKTKDL